jgi:hypothetical protein
MTVNMKTLIRLIAPLILLVASLSSAQVEKVTTADAVVARHADGKVFAETNWPASSSQLHCAEQ